MSYVEALVDQMTQTLARLEPSAAIQKALDEGVVWFLAEHPGIPPRMRAQMMRAACEVPIREKRLLLRTEAEKISRRLCSVGVEHAFIKGAALLFVASSYARKLRDLDIWIPHVHDVFRALRVFHEQGYNPLLQQSEACWFLDGRDPALHLVVAKHSVQVDIHGGSRLSFLAPPLVLSAGPIQVGSVSVLDSVDSCVVAMFHSAIESRITWRDLLDVAVLLDLGAPAKLVDQMARANRIGHVYSIFLRGITEGRWHDRVRVVNVRHPLNTLRSLYAGAMWRLIDCDWGYIPCAVLRSRLWYLWRVWASAEGTRESCKDGCNEWHIFSNRKLLTLTCGGVTLVGLRTLTLGPNDVSLLSSLGLGRACVDAAGS